MAEASAEQPKDVLYHPGISFRNPGIVRQAGAVRQNPWFYEKQGVGPLSASSKLRRFEKSGDLRRYKAVWSRSAKDRNMEKLGAYFQDIPTMDELGQAPPATGQSSSTVRGAFGFLDNVLTAATDAATGVTNVLQQREQQKQMTAQAQVSAYLPFLQRSMGGDNTMLWVAGLGIVGIGAFMYLRSR
jgi:hypothetical protein